MRLRVLLTLLAAAVALAVVPVAAPKSSAVETTTVTVKATDALRFVLSKKTVPHGVVVFKVTNGGKLQHDFKIAGKKTPLLKAGKSATLRVTLKKGSYKYLCTVPGHAAAGMKGTLRVT